MKKVLVSFLVLFLGSAAFAVVAAPADQKAGEVPMVCKDGVCKPGDHQVVLEEVEDAGECCGQMDCRHHGCGHPGWMKKILHGLIGLVFLALASLIFSVIFWKTKKWINKPEITSDKQQAPNKRKNSK